MEGSHVISGVIYGQASSLAISVLLGALLFLLYDLLRIFRRILPHGIVWIGVEDLLYWLIFTAAVFVMLYRENDGMLRGFVIGGIAAGMFFYYVLLSRFVIRLHVLLRAVLGVCGRVTGFFLRPIRSVQRKIGVFFKKRLKNVWRAVKMGLSKR